jgi:hypothetical protein
MEGSSSLIEKRLTRCGRAIAGIAIGLDLQWRRLLSLINGAHFPIITA